MKREMLLLAAFIIMPGHFGYKPRNVGRLRGKGDRRMNKKETRC